MEIAIHELAELLRHAQKGYECDKDYESSREDVIDGLRLEVQGLKSQIAKLSRKRNLRRQDKKVAQ